MKNCFPLNNHKKSKLNLQSLHDVEYFLNKMCCLKKSICLKKDIQYIKNNIRKH